MTPRKDDWRGGGILAGVKGILNGIWVFECLSFKSVFRFADFLDWVVEVWPQKRVAYWGLGFGNNSNKLTAAHYAMATLQQQQQQQSSCNVALFE